MALPLVALAVVVVLAAGGLGRAAVQCQEAARTGARLAARGETADVVRAGAAAAAPAGSEILVSPPRDGLVHVRVSLAAPVVAGGARTIGRVPLSCRSSAWSEADPGPRSAGDLGPPGHDLEPVLP